MTSTMPPEYSTLRRLATPALMGDETALHDLYLIIAGMHPRYQVWAIKCFCWPAVQARGRVACTTKEIEAFCESVAEMAHHLHDAKLLNCP